LQVEELWPHRAPGIAISEEVEAVADVHGATSFARAGVHAYIPEL
jgi:hypothetical protein